MKVISIEDQTLEGCAQVVSIVMGKLRHFPICATTTCLAYLVPEVCSIGVQVFSHLLRIIVAISCSGRMGPVSPFHALRRALNTPVVLPATSGRHRAFPISVCT